MQREVKEAGARVDEAQKELIGELNRAKERERRAAAECAAAARERAAAARERAAQQQRAAQERAAAQREMQAAAAQARHTPLQTIGVPFWIVLSTTCRSNSLTALLSDTNGNVWFIQQDL